MKLSIITPSFNQGQFIEQCINSVINQDYPNIEYLIIDGASSDQTVDIIKKYEANITYWVSEKDSGQTSAINKGIIKSSGEIVAYLCSDDYYAPGIAKFIMNKFISDPNLDMIYGNCTFVDEQGYIQRHKKSINFSRNKLLRRNIIWQPTVFIRKYVFDEVGLFDEELHYAMDYEFWLRISEKFNIVNIDKDLAFYRWHKNSKTITSEIKHLKEAYSIARKYNGGGLYSYFMHCIYWPRTSKIKHLIFKIYSKFRKH